MLTNVYSELPGRVGGEAGYGGEGGEVGLAGGHSDAAQQEVHGRVPVTHILYNFQLKILANENLVFFRKLLTSKTHGFK